MPMHRRVLPPSYLSPTARGIVVLAVLTSPLLGCIEAEEAAPGPEPTPPLVPRNAAWEDFPIVLEGVTDVDIDDYTIVIDGAPRGLEELVDVVAYARGFQPCDDLGGDPDADLDAFDYEYATTVIDAASAKGLSVMLPLPFLGNSGFPCDGVYDDPVLWNHDMTVQIPLIKNEITLAYTAYWSTKVESYIDSVVGYDSAGVVWAWRALDELRPSMPAELELARAMRVAVDDHDGSRLLMSYTGNAYMPGSDIIASLLDRPHPSLTPYEPIRVLLDPADPVARTDDAGVVADYYPHPVQLNRENGQLRPLFEHIMNGAYTEYTLGNDADTNRSFTYHRSRLSVEARDNLKAIYASFGETAPPTTVFHAPDLTAVSPSMSTTEAQHDFWAGLHVADGIYIYSFANAEDPMMSPTDAWDAYARGLYLIKSQMRDALAQGHRWTPSVTTNGAVATAPGDYYLGVLPVTPNRDFLASPLAPDEHATLNATMVSHGSGTYLIVTNSWAQPVDFEVDLPANATGAQIVYGSSPALNVVGTTLSDSFGGIDGRVYEISVAP